MLRKETISPPLLESLSTLMMMETIKTHRLVGGTALALQTGHRISIDIDLFSDKTNNYEDILQELSEKFGNQLRKGRYISGPMGKGITVFLNDIKTDILDWNSKFIRYPFIDENIRIAHKEEIIPMKFNTFLCAPEFARYEKKDYIDIAFLMKEYSLHKMIELYEEKYPDEIMSGRLMIEGLQLHELAEKKITPKMLIDFTWEDAKNQIEQSITLYNQMRIKN